LLSNATSIDSALNYIRSKQQAQHKKLSSELTGDDKDNDNDDQLAKAGRQSVF
jgi:hypothetical protein